jgi:23S rRNA pseudouridine2605 synthase/16S rRNA pseudouridine516 synthase
VTVNGNVVGNVRRGIDPETDDVRVDGERVEPESKVYIMLNKPKGYLTTMYDPHGRKTVSELVENVPQRVFPVGRLDKDTEGLLLMTNDGELTYRVTHPKFEIKKTYQAVVSGVVTDESLEKLRAGVQLSDGVTSPAEVRVLSRQGNSTSMEICITEGKKRQIRRMCSAVGHEVIELKRVATAGVVLRDVAPGKWRYLTPEEISQLRGPVSGSKDRDGSEKDR